MHCSLVLKEEPSQSQSDLNRLYIEIGVYQEIGTFHTEMFARF